MILATLKEKEIEISGHADYQEYGKDIVCAAVSTTIIVLANTIEKLGLLEYVDMDIKEGHAKIKQNTDNETVKNILEVLKDSIKDLEIQFPKNIKIKL